MDAHELHKAKRAHEDHIASDFRPKAAAFIAPEGVHAIMPAVLVVHDLLKKRRKTTARCLHHGVGKADDLADRAVGINFHAVERDVLRREQVCVLDRDAAFAAEHSGSVPAANGSARARKPPSLCGKGPGKAQENPDRETRDHKRRPRPEEAVFRLEHAQNREPQRHEREDGRIDAHDPAARVGNFELADKGFGVPLTSEDAVFPVPRLFFAHGGLRLVHGARGLERADFRKLHGIFPKQRHAQLQRHRRAERNAPGPNGKHPIHRARKRQYHQHARVVIPQLHHRAHAAQHHVKGDKRLHYHYNE